MNLLFPQYFNSLWFVFVEGVMGFGAFFIWDALIIRYGSLVVFDGVGANLSQAFVGIPALEVRIGICSGALFDY